MAAHLNTKKDKPGKEGELFPLASTTVLSVSIFLCLCLSLSISVSVFLHLCLSPSLSFSFSSFHQNPSPVMECVWCVRGLLIYKAIIVN